jgi:predicted nucleic acid-binding protein
MIAVDTNVLIGAIQTFDPGIRATARRAVKTLYRRDEELICFPQNLVEFWNASTRPTAANGLGFTPEEAARYVDRFQTLFRLLPETSEIFPAWRRLVLQHRISGIRVHDVRIAATMMIHKVPRILTFDFDDFGRFKHISALNPSSI